MQSGIFKGPITFDESPGSLVTYPGHIPVSGANNISLPTVAMVCSPPGGAVYPVASSGDYRGSQGTGVIFDHREPSNQLTSGAGAGMVLPSVGVVGN